MGRKFAGNYFHRELCVSRQKEGKDAARLDGYGLKLLFLISDFKMLF